MIFSGCCCCFQFVNQMNQNNFGNDPSVVVSMNPFDAIDVDSARFAQQKKGLVPAIPLHSSKSIPVTTSTETLKPIYSKLSTYPNPATNFIKYGLKFTGMSPDGLLTEVVELNDHPWFVGVQFHPELKSRPFNPHPLFASFIKASINVKS